MPTKLTLSGSVNYESEIDNFTAAKIIALVEQTDGLGQPERGNEYKQPDLINPVPTGISGRFASRSLIEAFDETGAKIKAQQLVVAGYRAMEESGEESFTSRHVIDQFRNAGINPKNIDREFKRAIASGLIFKELGKSGKYKVTDRALKAFNSGFGIVKIASSSKKGLKNNRPASTVRLEVSEQVKNLEIKVSMDGYPDYHDLKKKNDRIIWLLVFTAKNSILGLNSKELEHLAGKIRDNLNPSSVPALTDTYIKKGYIVKSGNDYKVLHKGDEHIKGK